MYFTKINEFKERLDHHYRLLKENMQLAEQKRIMIDYLQMKVNEQDWHAVADAAMDLRELEIQIKFTNNLPGQSSLTNSPPSSGGTIQFVPVK